MSTIIFYRFERVATVRIQYILVCFRIKLLRVRNRKTYLTEILHFCKHFGTWNFLNECFLIKLPLSCFLFHFLYLHILCHVNIFVLPKFRSFTLSFEVLIDYEHGEKEIQWQVIRTIATLFFLRIKKIHPLCTAVPLRR